jgi:hypothetical protein
MDARRAIFRSFASVGGAFAIVHALSACTSIQGLSTDNRGGGTSGAGGTVVRGGAGGGDDPGSTIQDPPASGDPGASDDDAGTPAPAQGAADDAGAPDDATPPSNTGCVSAGAEPIAIGSSVVGALIGGDAGAPFADACPAGAAIVGLNLVADPLNPNGLFQIQAVCAAISVDPCTAAVTFAAPAPLANEGTLTGVGSQLRCPAGAVATGIGVTAQKFIHAVSLACAPLVATASPSGVAWSLGTQVVVGPAGGSGNYPAASFDCPAGSIAASLSGTFGDNVHDYIDAIALGCGAPATSSAATAAH